MARSLTIRPGLPQHDHHPHCNQDRQSHRAGRYTEDDARAICASRPLADDALFPDDVMVPAPVPANGVGFTVDELRGLDDRMAWQVQQAGQQMVEERDNQRKTTEETTRG